MTFRDKITNFRNIALVGMATSIYNEDSMTATELTLVSAKKVRECMQVISGLCDLVETMSEKLELTYDENNQELNLSLRAQIEAIKTDATNCYASPYNENAMTSLELAGCTAKQVNECVRIVNMLTDTLYQMAGMIDMAYDENNQELTVGDSYGE